MVTHEEFKALYDLAILANGKARGMLGEILLSILESRPAARSVISERVENANLGGSLIVV